MDVVRRAAGIPVVCAILAAGAIAVLGAAAPPRDLTHEDVRWLDRVTFGIDSTIVARYRELGRARFLDGQLHPPSDDPPDIAGDLKPLSITRESVVDRLRAARAEQQRINSLADDGEKQRARMALNQAGRELVYETSERHLMRDIYSPSQLREQMTWFWMNHFNVFAGKGQVRLGLPDYEEHAVRAHALGHFRELVLATLESPAMLEYLDNAQSAAGKINENYARELMELHTLGVSGGASGSTYSQQDVQELARVLTGVGVNPTGEERRFGPAKRGFYVHDGVFEFNPNRHDFEPKTVLGERIDPRGFGEVERAVTLLCRQPATAKFISTQLATYFVADEPPPKLIAAMVATFEHTDGDIADVLKTMFLSPDFTALLNRPQESAGKFKDPVQFVVSSLRLAYDGKRISNYRPVVNWLTQLGEPLYGRVTPDGYPLTESAWTSSGQMVKRFEIARAIGSGNAGLFNTDDGKPGPRAGFPMLNTRLYYDAIEPTLGARTRGALAQTMSQQEWNMVLLSSPEWMER